MPRGAARGAATVNMPDRRCGTVELLAAGHPPRARDNPFSKSDTVTRWSDGAISAILLGAKYMFNGIRAQVKKRHLPKIFHRVCTGPCDKAVSRPPGRRKLVRAPGRIKINPVNT